MSQVTEITADEMFGSFSSRGLNVQGRKIQAMTDYLCLAQFWFSMSRFNEFLRLVIETEL